MPIVIWRWLILLAYTVAWTIALLAPVPDAEDLPFGEDFITHKVLFSKTVHVSAYAVFTVLVGWQRVPLGWRPLLLFMLMLHGAGTEWLQEILGAGRTGLLSDVLFNHLGIGIGLFISWKWWTRPEV